MLYVVAEQDHESASYFWYIYDDDQPTRPIRGAEFSYPTRTAALDAGWAAADEIEKRRRARR